MVSQCTLVLRCNFLPAFQEFNGIPPAIGYVEVDFTPYLSTPQFIFVPFDEDGDDIASYSIDCTHPTYPMAASSFHITPAGGLIPQNLFNFEEFALLGWDTKFVCTIRLTDTGGPQPLSTSYTADIVIIDQDDL